MSKLVWDKIGERYYETGVKNGVLYVFDTETKKYGKGVAWNVPQRAGSLFRFYRAA